MNHDPGVKRVDLIKELLQIWDEKVREEATKATGQSTRNKAALVNGPSSIGPGRCCKLFPFAQLALRFH